MKEAETLEQKSLKAKKRLLDDEHSRILVTAMNLAAIYSEWGRFVEVIEIEEKNLETKKRVLGVNDSATLDSVRNLEVIYRKWSKSPSRGVVDDVKMQEDDSLRTIVFVWTIDKEIDREMSKTCWIVLIILSPTWIGLTAWLYGRRNNKILRTFHMRVTFNSDISRPRKISDLHL